VRETNQEVTLSNNNSYFVYRLSDRSTKYTALLTIVVKRPDINA